MAAEGTNATNGVPQGWRTRFRAAWQALTGEASAADRAVPPPVSAVAVISDGAVIDAVIGGIPAPTIVIDRDGKVLAFNAPAAAIAPALRPAEPALITLRMPEVVDAIRRVSTTGESQRVEYYQRVPVERWFEVFVAPAALPSGEAKTARELLVMTFHDLTPLRRVEEMRADFVANASHELRTPLAALSGFIETLQGPARDDVAARERFLGIMRSQAARMARLIDDLLSLSRIELNAHLRPNTPVDLAPIVRQVVDGLQPLARERDVEIRIDTPPASLTVLGDRDELVRAIENLVENALKYGASGKGVDIALSRGVVRDGTEEARIVVRDYGPGIAPEHLPRLTERFYRVDVAGSRAQGGTGLGLALVKHVLNRHGGRLAIESAPGAGATFTLHLPLRPAAVG
ncbi:MAG: sensor histidine kinase [Xanthobacteraceae bacterium]|uniref:sensor histidine kinase n=1 Tax=Pseudolabrys sp. TaxID=1960880 RepID=UPI003D1369B1